MAYQYHDMVVLSKSKEDPGVSCFGFQWGVICLKKLIQDKGATREHPDEGVESSSASLSAEKLTRRN